MKPRKTEFDFSIAGLRRPQTYHHGDAWGPPQFTNWIDESLSWKQTCYIGDWSFLPVVKYRGPDVLRLFSDISVNSMNNFEVGQSKHIIHCNENGKLIEEGILSRFSEDEYVAFSTTWADYIARRDKYDVQSEYISMAILHIQGPNSLHLMEKMTGENLRDMKFMRFRTFTVANHEVKLLRQGMTGELGFELQAPAEIGKELWDAIYDAGQEFGIRQLGGRVGMINHLEANYPTYALDYLPAVFDGANLEFLKESVATGGDYSYQFYGLNGSFESEDITEWYRSPVELGWGNRIKFDHDFVGAEALRAELADPKRSIATLVWNAEDVVGVYAALFQDEPLPEFMEMPQDPRAGYYADKVLKDGKLIGMTSSRGYSAYARKMLSLCVIDREYLAPGTEVTVIWGSPGTPQREIRATVERVPFKEDRGRVDLNSIPPFAGLLA